MGDGGKILLEAIAASKLKKLEKFLSKQDPYVVFSFGDATERTETHADAGSEPRWKAKGLKNTVTLSANGKPSGSVEVRVMNDNGKKEHKLIGEGSLEFDSSLGKSGKTVTVDLTNGSKKAGSVDIVVGFSSGKKDKSKKAAAAAQATKEASEEDSSSGEEVEKARADTDEHVEEESHKRGESVRITALRAKKLKNVQMVFAQDPYVKVTIGSKSARTLQSSGKNPSWDKSKNHVMAINVDAPPDQVLFEVLDAEKLRADRLIGSCTMAFTEIAGADPGSEVEVSLNDAKGKSAGVLIITAEIPNSLRGKKGSGVSGTGTSHEKGAPTTDDGSDAGPDNAEEVEEEKVAADAADSAPADRGEKGAKSSLPPGKLTITVLEGVALKKVQMIGEQDPYVKGTLLPWSIVSDKTKTLSGRNPKWASGNVLEFDFPGELPAGQIPKMRLDVYDEEFVMSDRLIGNGEIDLTPFLTGQNTDGAAQVELEDKKYKAAGKLKVNVSFEKAQEGAADARSAADPEVLKKIQVEGVLTVTAQSAALTRSVETFGKQDPFMEVALLPWGDDLQQGRTDCVDGAGKQVTWEAKHKNEMTLFYPGASSTGEAPTLRVQVKDAETLRSNRLIGSGTVDLAPILTKMIRKIDKGKSTESAKVTVELLYEKKNKQKSCGTAQVTIGFVKGIPAEMLKKMEPSLLEAPDTGQGPDQKPHEDKTKPYELFATVHSASKLKNRAWVGKQDPYVRLTLMPWGAVAKTQPVVDGGTNVEWNSKLGNALSMPYDGARTDELPFVLIEVMDRQLGGDRLIGSRKLGMSCFLRAEANAIRDLNVPLLARGGKKSAGTVSLSMHCVEKKGSTSTRCGALRVNIRTVSTTTAGDWFGKNDIYVVLRPTPGVKGEPVRTVIKNEGGLAAEINQELVVPMFDTGMNGVGPANLQQSLRFDVMDKDWMFDDVLGTGIKELGEIFAGGEDYDPKREHEISILKPGGKKSGGNVYAQIEFVPSKFVGEKALEGLKSKAGSIRIWALEARGLKHVGGVLDKKQDPYLKVVLQKPGQPDPGAPKSSGWPKKQRTRTASDAGRECVWNSYIDLEHSEADAAFAASGKKPGFLHIAAFDEGVASDTVIGAYTVDLFDLFSNATGEVSDAWVTIFDTGGKKTGEVRIAAEYVPALDSDKVAMRDEFAFVEEGSLHLLVAELSGLSQGKAKKVQGRLFLGDKVVDKLAPVSTASDGIATWNHLAEIQWSPSKLNPTTEPVMAVPSLRFDLSGQSGSAFGVNRSLGSCNVPIQAFLPQKNGVGTSIERSLQICLGPECKDTFLTLRVVGIFQPAKPSPLDMAVTAATIAAMSNPAVNLKDEQGRRHSFNSKSPPVRHAFPGRLHMRVLEGKNLASRDIVGKQDPYVQGMLEPGGSKFRTATCEDGGKAPIWTSSMNNEHELLVEDAAAAILKLKCFDADQVSDDLIGFLDVPILPIAAACRAKRKSSTPASEDEKVTSSHSKDGATLPWSKHLLTVKADARAASAAKQAFSSSKWKRFCAEGFAELHGKSSSSDRRGNLVKFYKGLEEDGIAVLDDLDKQVEKLMSKYPDKESVNKDLFTKLYKRYRPEEKCPESLWKGNPQSNTGDVVLSGQGAKRIIEIVEGGSGPFLPGAGSSANMSTVQLKQLDRSLTGLFPEAEGEPVTSRSFTELAQVVFAVMVSNAIDAGSYDLSQIATQEDVGGAVESSVAADTGTGEEDFGSTMWWTLRNAKGKPQGRLKLQLWFTEDWEPIPRNAPAVLLQPGTFWIQVKRAEFTADNDIFGKQDPFVKVSWSGGDAPKSMQPQKTPYKSNAGKAAEWDEKEGLLKLPYSPELAFSATQAGQTPSLLIQALDKDTISSDVIGETKLPLVFFASHEGTLFPRALPLINTRKGQTTRAGTLTVRMQFVSGEESQQASSPPWETNEVAAEENAEGEHKTEVGAPSIPGRALVTIVAARGLKDVQWVGKMDPVANIRLWPNNQVARTKEATDQDANPVWKEEHQLDTEDAEAGLLEISVTTGGSTFGSCAIALCNVLATLASNPAGVENWFPIVSPKLKICGEVLLKIGFEKDSDAEGFSMDGSAVKYVAGPGDLHIKIKRAVDLSQGALAGNQDPYVSLESIGWRSQYKAKSDVDENGGRNPNFDFSSNTTLEWNPTDRNVPGLQLSIRDRNTIKDATIFSSKLCIAPWLLAPGQIAHMWLPTYGTSSGPYKYEPKKGAVQVDMQYIPKASFSGKPKSAFARGMIKNIQSAETPRVGEVHVQVIAARNLVDVQAIGKQDPYVKLTLVAGGGEGEAKLHFCSARTRQIDNGGSNPRWEEDLLLPYSEIALGLHDNQHGSTPLLLVEVWDSNIKLMGDKLIGRTIYPLFPFLLDGGQVADAWCPITSPGTGKRMGEVHLGAQFRREGEGKRVLPSEMPENTLNVIVVRGRNLYDAGDGPLDAAQDPEVHLEFVGMDQVYKTEVAMNQGTEPVWEERIKMSGCMPGARGTFPRLRMQVYDYDSATASDFIGMCEFSLTKKIMGDLESGAEPQAHEQTFQLVDRSGKIPRGELQLILKRGPFPGDPLDGPGELGDGKVYVTLHGVSEDLTREDGKRPKKPFVRATSRTSEKELGKRDSKSVLGKQGGGFGEQILVVPVRADESSTLALSIYEHKWTLRGQRPKLVAEATVPKLSKLLLAEEPSTTPTKLSLALTSSSTGPVLGTLDASVLYLPRVAGQLRVVVESASDIKSMEMLGKNDLRVELSVQNGASASDLAPPEFTTTKHDAGKSATWNETKQLIYSNEKETTAPMLRARVVDVDLAANDVCGECEISLLSLLTEGYSKGTGGSAEIPLKAYRLDKGGTVTLGITFLPNSNIFAEKRQEESKAIMELKRMWNFLDANHDGRLTMEELQNGFSSVPNCAAFLGVDETLFAASNVQSATFRSAVHDLFAEINTNDDDIIDFDEFRAYIEGKPQRDQTKRVEEERDRQKEREARSAIARREQQERARLHDLRKEEEQDELDARRREQREEAAKLRAEQRKRDAALRKRREEELAKLAAARAADEARKAQEEAQLLKEEQERRRRQGKRAARLDHKRPQDVMLWRTRDVVEWLGNDLELPEYCAAFAEAAVDGPLLVVLTDEELVAQLHVQDSIHRRKILIRAARLFQMHQEKSGANAVKSKSKSSKPKKNSKTALELGAAASAGSNEMMRMKLAQQYKRDHAHRAAKSREDEMRQQIWKFEYDTEKTEGLVPEDDDPLDWYSKDADAFDCDDGSDDEGSFRQAMGAVRSRIVSNSGSGESKVDSLGIDNEEEKEKSLHLTLSTVRDSIITANSPLSNDGHTLVLKNGELLKSQSPSSKRIKSLPEEFWFEDKMPWWEDINDNQDSRVELDETLLSSKGANRLRKVPDQATASEMQQVIRVAVAQFGKALERKRTKATALSTSQNPADRERQMLKDVFSVWCRMENHAADRVDALTRLKFQGGIKNLLGIELNWIQFDRLFRLVSPAKGDGTSGTIQFAEFYEAFRTINVDRKGRRAHRKSSGPNSGGKMSSHKEQTALRAALFGVCETLLKSETSLKDLFRGFDRNGSGSISTAEFVSMMRSLSEQLSKQQIYDLLKCMDSDFSRTISNAEFMDFWLVVYSQWLRDLKQRLLSGNNKPVKLSNGRRVRPEELEQLVRRVQKTVDVTFGARFSVMSAEERDVLPGPMSSLLRVIGMDDHVISASLSRTKSPHSSRALSMSGGQATLRASRDRSAASTRTRENASLYQSQASDSINELLRGTNVTLVSDLDEYGPDSPRGNGLDAVRAARKRQTNSQRGYGENELERMNLTQASSSSVRRQASRGRGSKLGIPKVQQLDTSIKLISDTYTDI